MGKRPLNFGSSIERENWIRDNADYFTVVRRLPPPQGYERHEVKTFDDAKNLAKTLANKAKRVYLIYAVEGESSTFLTSINPD